MPRRPSPIKHRCPHATQRTRSPSDFQSEPIVVWRSSSSASDSLAVRDFGVPAADEMFAISLRKPLTGTAFMVRSVRQRIKFACAQAVVKRRASRGVGAGVAVWVFRGHNTRCRGSGPGLPAQEIRPTESSCRRVSDAPVGARTSVRPARWRQGGRGGMNSALSSERARGAAP